MNHQPLSSTFHPIPPIPLPFSLSLMEYDKDSTSSGDLKNTIQVSERTTTFFDGCFALCKAAIGVGGFLLSSILAEVGLLYGLFLIILCSLYSTSSLHLLSRISANTGHTDYFDIGKMAYGGIGEMASIVALLAFLSGTLIFFISFTAKSFLSVYFTVMDVEVTKDLKTNTQMIILLLVSAVIIYGMAIMRDMKSLGKASLFGMICVGIVVLFVAGAAMANCFGMAVSITEGGFSNAPMLWKGISSLGVSTIAVRSISSFSRIIFAFVNHFTIIAVIPKLVDPSTKRRKMLTIVSSAIILGIYVILAVGGLLIDPQNKGAITMIAFKKDSIYSSLFTFANFLVGCNLILSYPLILDPFRTCLEVVIKKIFGFSGRKETTSIWNLGLTASILIVMLLPSIIFINSPKVPEDILGLMVALSGPAMLFIFPSLFFLKLGSKKMTNESNFRIFKWENVLSYILIATGVIVTLTGTYDSILTLKNTLTA